MCFKTAKERSTDLFEIPPSREDELGVTWGPEVITRQVWGQSAKAWDHSEAAADVPSRYATHAPWPSSCKTCIISSTSKWIASISFARAIYVVSHKQTNHLPNRQTANRNPKKTFLTEFFRITQAPESPVGNPWFGQVMGVAGGKSEEQSPCRLPGEEKAVL